MSSSPCPICASPLPEAVLRLGQWPTTLNRALPSPGEARKVPRGELVLAGCPVCGWLVNVAFRNTDHFDALYSCAQRHSGAWREQQRLQLEGILRGRAYARVVEIGCGDGWVLEQLRREGLAVSGFDPTYRGADPAIAPRAYLPGEPLQADLVYLQHVLDEVPEVGALLRGLAQSAPKADVVIDVLDAARLAQPCGLLDLALERCNYATWGALSGLFERVERRPGVQGHLLLRAPLARLRSPRSPVPPPMPDVQGQLALQRALARTEGPLYIWGASNKGGNLARLLDPGACRVAALVDLSPDKQGRYLPGTGHPIWAPEALSRALPGQVIAANEAYVQEIASVVSGFGPKWRVVGVEEWAESGTR